MKLPRVMQMTHRAQEELELLHTLLGQLMLVRPVHGIPCHLCGSWRAELRICVETRALYSAVKAIRSGSGCGWSRLRWEATNL